MTLEITRPETEARIQRYLQSGQFHDLDEILTKAGYSISLSAALSGAASSRWDERAFRNHLSVTL